MCARQKDIFRHSQEAQLDIISPKTDILFVYGVLGNVTGILSETIYQTTLCCDWKVRVRIGDFPNRYTGYVK